MAQRYSELHARRVSVGQLGNVVGAMRGVAAARARQCRQQIGPVRAYADIVARAISQVLAMAPQAAPAAGQTAGALGVLLLCAEHGFAGAFSEKILDSAADQDSPLLMVVGSRGVRLARARGWTPAWTAPMVSQAAGAGALAGRVGAELFRQLGGGRVSRIDLIYARALAGDDWRVLRRPLLPFDFGRFGAAQTTQPPLLHLPAGQLLERLAGEHLFAQLHEAIMESFAAENAARLQTMTAARDNIGRRREALSREEQLARQEAITDEIIELAAGSEAQR